MVCRDIPKERGSRNHPANLARTLEIASKVCFSLTRNKDPKLNLENVAKTFWPADLLPRDFENARILTHGYDSRVTKGFTAPTSKNGIFQHGNSFLRALSRVRLHCGGRPIIFVAHSLGYVPLKTLHHDQFFITGCFQGGRSPPYSPKHLGSCLEAC